MSRVIAFPAEKSKRVLNLRRQENRRMVLMSSLFSVIALGLAAQIKIESTNREVAYALKTERPTADAPQRAIASVGAGKAGELRADLAWEQKLAAKLGGMDARLPASIGSSCKGALCVLGPSYRIVYENGVRGAAFADGLAEDGVKGLPAADVPRILEGMRGLGNIQYDTFFRNETAGVLSKEGNVYQTWELRKEGERAPAGFAVVRETARQIRAFAFCSAEEVASDLAGCLKKVE